MLRGQESGKLCDDRRGASVTYFGVVTELIVVLCLPITRVIPVRVPPLSYYRRSVPFRVFSATTTE